MSLLDVSMTNGTLWRLRYTTVSMLYSFRYLPPRADNSEHLLVTEEQSNFYTTLQFQLALMCCIWGQEE